MIVAQVPRKSSENVACKTTNDMTNFETGAVRDTGGKGRMDLLPMCALLRVSKHMEDALTHYPERNWEKGMPMHCMVDSALRHLVKYIDGMTDEDHLCSAATNLLMAMWMEEKRPDMQDIPSRVQETTADPNMIPGQVTIDDLMKSSRTCSSWRVVNGIPRCYGTKEMDECHCGADKSVCDFYPDVRAKFGQKG